MCSTHTFWLGLKNAGVMFQLVALTSLYLSCLHKFHVGTFLCELVCRYPGLFLYKQSLDYVTAARRKAGIKRTELAEDKTMSQCTNLFDVPALPQLERLTVSARALNTVQALLFVLAAVKNGPSFTVKPRSNPDK